MKYRCFSYLFQVEEMIFYHNSDFFPAVFHRAEKENSSAAEVADHLGCVMQLQQRQLRDSQRHI